MHSHAHNQYVNLGKQASSPHHGPTYITTDLYCDGAESHPVSMSLNSLGRNTDTDVPIPKVLYYSVTGIDQTSSLTKLDETFIYSSSDIERKDKLLATSPYSFYFA